MKKLLLIFLLALLPLQFSWAAAAAYCQHEGEKSSQHFGHHSHQHDASADRPDDTDKVVKGHADCGYCHAYCQVSALTSVPEVVLPTGSTHVEKPTQSYSSHIPDGLQRPDWRLVA
ncbi:cation efflux protein, CzcI family [Noviherbaspirillum sp. ST9]|uniref:cation efflux protein, CzcI family n=1 Tax=Noviherbaspirillum sp. ST9 TaxID=3401606 RepID=UPI003B58A8F7